MVEARRKAIVGGILVVVGTLILWARGIYFQCGSRTPQPPPPNSGCGAPFFNAITVIVFWGAIVLLVSGIVLYVSGFRAVLRRRENSGSQLISGQVLTMLPRPLLIFSETT